MRFPRQPYNVLNHPTIATAPDEEGLYGLFRLQPDGRYRCMFVGFGNIRRRLRQHIDGVPPEILAENPTFWVTARTSAVEETHARLVEEYDPPHHDPESVFLPYSKAATPSSR